MSREDIQTNIRLPADLKEALTCEAKASRRSLSAEIVERLTTSLAPIDVVDALSEAFIGDRPLSEYGGYRDTRVPTGEAIYSTLLKVADVLSTDSRSVEQERNLLADVVRLMARMRTGYYK